MGNQQESLFRHASNPGTSALHSQHHRDLSQRDEGAALAVRIERRDPQVGARGDPQAQMKPSVLIDRDRTLRLTPGLDRDPTRGLA